MPAFVSFTGLVIVFTAACGGAGGGTEGTTAIENATATSPAAATAAPAAGSPAGPEAGGYAATRVYPQLDFERMVEMAWIPGAANEAVVLTQQGIIYRAALDREGEEPSVFLDLRGKLIDSPGNEEGLLGFAWAPDFAQSRAFFVNYTAGGRRRSVISRFTMAEAAADPASEHVILEVSQPFANHNGGALEFGPDGMLYIALGDGGSAGDPQGNGQNTDTLLGKILRIDVSADGYRVPPDNPFAGGGGRGEIWAYGLRNPWRITFDRETGGLWAGDVGQSAWEEVDRIERGGNYGWNVMEGNDCYRAPSCDREGTIPPRAVYPTRDGCAISGGYVYRGAAMPELRGWYVYADFCSGAVWALDTRDGSPPVELTRTGQQIPSFAEAPDGEIYLLSFGRAVYRLTRR